MLEGNYRGSVCRLGPRALGFAPGVIGAGVVSNCPTCPSGKTDFVYGENGAAPPQLLVHGWYTFQTEVSVYIQQVRPKDVCNTDPAVTGQLVLANGVVSFFVDAARRDGALVLRFCDATAPTSCVSEDVAPPTIARVVRQDTILPMSETGEDADLASPAASAEKFCKSS